VWFLAQMEVELIFVFSLKTKIVQRTAGNRSKFTQLK